MYSFSLLLSTSLPSGFLCYLGKPSTTSTNDISSSDYRLRNWLWFHRHSVVHDVCDYSNKHLGVGGRKWVKDFLLSTTR
ncbi:hypothetical protein F4810DRAFT_660318 [Camillea tinctor]|nr:hypothetical protein F4810DRAFT_660318 [Camillea tinctor]